MSDLATYGSIITGPDVERAVMAILEERMEEYVARMERHEGRDPKSVELPQSFITRNDRDHWPQEMLPSVVVTSPGLSDEPKKEGDKSYRAKWAVGVGVMCGADTPTNAEALAKFYGAAVRECLLQHPSLEGFSEGVIWEHEKYDEIPSENQNLFAASVIFLSLIHI